MRKLNKSEVAEDWWMFTGLHKDIERKHKQILSDIEYLTLKNYKCYINSITNNIEELRNTCTQYGYCKKKELPVETAMTQKMLSINNLV